jgi:hypothetical protein
MIDRRHERHDRLSHRRFARGMTLKQVARELDMTPWLHAELETLRRLARPPTLRPVKPRHVDSFVLAP